jgi:hypothetical protein
VSTGGLMRLANGEPAAQLMVMPGRVSWWTERMAARKADKAAKWLDYSGKQWAKVMPVDGEPLLAGLDDATRQQLGDVQRNLLRTGTADGQGFNYFARARARMERINRRVSTVLPTIRNFDLTDASTLKDVERFARFYLSKGDARMLAAAYAAGDLAARRAVVRGMLVQSFHASGLSRSVAGQEFIRRYVGDLDGIDAQMYGLKGTDLVHSDRGQIHAALSNSQLSTTVAMPALKEMNRLALRFQTDGWLGSRAMSAGLGMVQSNRMDALYGHIKMGWITSAAGGLRNGLDELAGFMAKGMFSQWVRGRQAWTQATQEARAKRIEFSQEYRDLAKTYGQHGARDEVSRLSGNAQVDLEKAQRDHEAAVKAQAARDNLENALQARLDKANEHLKYHEDAHFDAQTQLRALHRSPGTATPETLAAAQARVDEAEANVMTWSRARGRAKMQMTKLPETRAKLEESFASRGILDVDEAEEQLANAKLQFEHARGLENAIHYRIPYMLRRFGDSVNDALFGVTAGKLMRVFGPRWVPSADQVKWIGELQNEELRAVLRDGVQQTHYGDNYSAINGPQAAMDMHRAGLQARSYAFQPNGWGEVEPDGGQGLDDWAKFMQLHLGDPTEPAHAWVQTVAGMTGRSTQAEHVALPEDFFDKVRAGEVQGVSDEARQALTDAHARWEDLRNEFPDKRDQVMLGANSTLHELEAAQQTAMTEHLEHQLVNGKTVQYHPEQSADSIDGPVHLRNERDLNDLLDDIVDWPGAEADTPFMHLSNPGRWHVSQVVEREHPLDGTVIQAARDSVRAYLDDPAMRHFLANAEVMRYLNDGTKVTDAATLARAKDEAADRISANMMHGLMVRGSTPVWVPGDPTRAYDLARQVAAGTHKFPVPEDVRERIVDLQRRTDSLNTDVGRIGRDDPGALGMRNELDPEASWGDTQARLAHEQYLLNEVRSGRPVFYDDGQGYRKIDNEADLQEVMDDDFVSLDDPDAFRAGKQQVNGRINDKLLDQLAMADHIGTPDSAWLSHNVPKDERPEHTVGQLWAPYNAAHVPGEMPTGYTPMLTKAYGKVVTDQVDALSRNPLIAALYMNARKNTLPWERYLVDEAGWDEASAAAVVQRMALSHAEQEAFKHIDNPHVASQFSLISRNFVNFERAQEDWLRRWGRAIKDNPAIIRKAQLTLHAGTATGLVESDPTQPNSLYFVYPGSHMAISMFNKAMVGLGLGEQVQIPVMGELTSQLQFMSPSLSQPFGLTVSPLLSLPFKALASTVGQDHQLLMNSLDKAMNGTLGSGRSWYEQILPPTINRILRGVIESDPGSQYGQAYANATMALGAAGHFDKLDGNDPTAVSNTQDALGVQVRNNMGLNALFGLFAPAVPGVDYNSSGQNVDGKQGTDVDWSAHLLGYKSLKVEAQQALSDLGPEKFRLWWAAVHPNELIWDPTSGVSSHTTAGANNAYLPATLNAAVWMQNNPDFLAKYGGAGGIGAYFLPGSGAAGQQFNDIAYRAQLQDHMRELKPLDQLLPAIIIQRGESEYYAAKDGYDAQIQAAKDSGDNYSARQLEDQWSTERQDIYARNPLLAQKNASYAVNGSEQTVAIGRLRALLDDHSPETVKAVGDLRTGVGYLLSAYDDYQTGDAALAGRRGNAATQARAQLTETYQAQVASVAQQYPDLADLVRGVFRTP